MGGIILWHVRNDLISSRWVGRLRVDPLSTKQRFLENWDKEGIEGRQVLPPDSQDSG